MRRGMTLLYRFARSFLAVLVCALCGWLGAIPLQAADRTLRAEPPRRYALLIGCTRYPYCPTAPELWGPANDIPTYAALLQSKFDVPEANMRMLLGWPAEPAQRPTHANISAAFEDLIQQVQAGDQVAIMINGHGTQLPALETGHETGQELGHELDGLDEAFLPADVRPGLALAIRDNQFSHWLTEFVRRGAHVWIVFDCCHSGTMTRDALARERTRGLSARSGSARCATRSRATWQRRGNRTSRRSHWATAESIARDAGRARVCGKRFCGGVLRRPGA